MQIHRVGYRIRGFKKLVRYASSAGMMTEKAKHKAQVLTFWAKHGFGSNKRGFQNKTGSIQSKTGSKRVQYVVAQYSFLTG